MAEVTYSTFQVHGMSFGIAVDSVREILRDQRVEAVPRSGRGLLGIINRRGRILAVTDVRALMGLPAASGADAAFFVVQGPAGLEVLHVDTPGEVLTVDDSLAHPIPETTPAAIAAYLTGTYELEDRLLLVIDLNQLLHATDERE